MVIKHCGFQETWAEIPVQDFFDALAELVDQAFERQKLFLGHKYAQWYRIKDINGLAAGNRQVDFLVIISRAIYPQVDRDLAIGIRLLDVGVDGLVDVGGRIRNLVERDQTKYDFLGCGFVRCEQDSWHKGQGHNYEHHGDNLAECGHK